MERPRLFFTPLNKIYSLLVRQAESSPPSGALYQSSQTQQSGPSGLRRTLVCLTTVICKEKFSLPLRPGLTSRNLGDSGDGAHPVLRFSTSAGFSHPRNPEISRTEPALMGVGEGEFLLRNVSAAESPLAGRGIRAVGAKSQHFALGPHERGGLKASIDLVPNTRPPSVPGRRGRFGCEESQALGMRISPAGQVSTGDEGILRRRLMENG